MSRTSERRIASMVTSSELSGPRLACTSAQRAAALALNQKDFLQAAIGDPRYYRVFGVAALGSKGDPRMGLTGSNGISGGATVSQRVSPCLQGPNIVAVAG